MINDGNVHSAIREFAEFIGTKVSFENDGSCAFRFAQSGLFFITSSSDRRDLVLTLSRTPGSTNFNYERALKAGAADIDTAKQLVSVGLNKLSDVVVSMRLSQANVNLQTLLAALDLLKKRQQEIML